MVKVRYNFHHLEQTKPYNKLNSYTKLYNNSTNARSCSAKLVQKYVNCQLYTTTFANLMAKDGLERIKREPSFFEIHRLALQNQNQKARVK